MPDEIHISTNDAETQAQIEKLALFLSDLRPFWPIMKRLVTGAGGWWSRQFDTEGSFAGHEWAALSPRYEAIKATVFPGKPILQATGGLRHAASDPKVEYTPRSMILTIDDSNEEHGIARQAGPVLQYLQDGTDHMPARPLVFGDPLPAAARVELEQAAEDYIRDLVGRL